MAEHDGLVGVIDGMGDVAIAVSGGVDSMTLAHVAHAGSSARVRMFHAVSPAVPVHATERVREHAAEHGWALSIVGAGEFSDPDYLRNPVNRCYFCKSNLYARIASAVGDTQICSGTNTDDLGDFRPGLGAAGEQGVRHPFVEAGIDKSAIRRIAAFFGLADIAELPAQPCLASRVETGLPIDAGQLLLVDQVEQLVARTIGPGNIRARVTQAGIRLEVPAERVSSVDQTLIDTLAGIAARAGQGWAGIVPYVRGSAFIGKDGA